MTKNWMRMKYNLQEVRESDDDASKSGGKKK